MDKEGGEQAMLLDNDQWNMFERNHRGYDRGPATGSLKFQLRQFAEDTLGEDSLKLAVNLPEGEDKSEWIACHILDFYNHTSILYSSISHLCTDTTCPTMSAGPKYEYLWVDRGEYVRPTRMPANAYISNLMRWINTLIDDETTFPVEKDARFDENFITEVASVVFKRLLRVYSHLYHHHFSAVCDAGLKSVLNTSFHHFVLFVTRFRLVSSREFAPVRDIVKAIM